MPDTIKEKFLPFSFMGITFITNKDITALQQAYEREHEEVKDLDKILRNRGKLLDETSKRLDLAICHIQALEAKIRLLKEHSQPRDPNTGRLMKDAKWKYLEEHIDTEVKAVTGTYPAGSFFDFYV